MFTLKHNLCTFVEKMLRVAFTHLYGPNRSGCLDWGVGSQPKIGNACILVLQPLPKFAHLSLYHIYMFVCHLRPCVSLVIVLFFICIICIIAQRKFVCERVPGVIRVVGASRGHLCSDNSEQCPVPTIYR